MIFLGWAEAAIKREKMIKQSLKIADSERNRRYYQKNRNKVKRRVKENYIKLRLHIIEILGGGMCFLWGNKRLIIKPPPQGSNGS